MPSRSKDSILCLCADVIRIMINPLLTFSPSLILKI